MSGVREFLKSLSDRELAFLIKFKYSGYLNNSKKLILEEVDERGLSNLALSKLVEDSPFGGDVSPLNQCMRCGSFKLSTVSELKKFTGRMEAIGYIFSGKSGKVEKTECLVCGYVLSDPNRDREVKFDWVEKVFRRKKK